MFRCTCPQRFRRAFTSSLRSPLCPVLRNALCSPPKNWSRSQPDSEKKLPRLGHLPLPFYDVHAPPEGSLNERVLSGVSRGRLTRASDCNKTRHLQRFATIVDICRNAQLQFASPLTFSFLSLRNFARKREQPAMFNNPYDYSCA
jgi:hypothetical protein